MCLLLPPYELSVSTVSVGGGKVPVRDVLMSVLHQGGTPAPGPFDLARWRRRVQEPSQRAGCWTASTWPQTLRFAAICFVWVGCRTLSKALGGAARRLTSTCTVLRFGRQVVVRPQLCDFRLRIFLVSSGSVRGTHACKPDVPTLACAPVVADLSCLACVL